MRRGCIDERADSRIQKTRSRQNRVERHPFGTGGVGARSVGEHARIAGGQGERVGVSTGFSFRVPSIGTRTHTDAQAAINRPASAFLQVWACVRRKNVTHFQEPENGLGFGKKLTTTTSQLLLLLAS